MPQSPPMEATRPHYDWPIEQLVEHADQHAHHRPVLQRVLAELDHRPGSRAKLIARRIERRLAMLDAPNRTGTHDLRTALAAAAEEIEMLRRHLAEADHRIEELERFSTAPSTPHAKLHLTPDAPLWLVTEMRRAYRRRYHPDKHLDPEARRRAEAAFKRAEEIFASLPPAPEE